MLRNPHNWVSLYRAAWVFSNPLQLLVGVLQRKAPATIRLRTPTHAVELRLRNFESLKTAFSVFCREDYAVDGEHPLHFLDVGANIGLSAVYFLSRNSRNTVRCYEPDAANLEFLRANLAPFGVRAKIEERAVGVTDEPLMLFRSADGKYSSTLPHADTVDVTKVETHAFSDVLREVRRVGWPTLVKLDVEGAERALVASIDFADYPNVQRLVCESTECAALIGRSHTRTVRNGYIEDLRFIPTALA